MNTDTIETAETPEARAPQPKGKRSFGVAAKGCASGPSQSTGEQGSRKPFDSTAGGGYCFSGRCGCSRVALLRRCVSGEREHERLAHWAGTDQCPEASYCSERRRSADAERTGVKAGGGARARSECSKKG